MDGSDDVGITLTEVAGGEGLWCCTLVGDPIAIKLHIRTPTSSLKMKRVVLIGKECSIARRVLTEPHHCWIQLYKSMTCNIDMAHDLAHAYTSLHTNLVDKFYGAGNTTLTNCSP